MPYGFRLAIEGVCPRDGAVRRIDQPHCDREVAVREIVDRGRKTIVGRRRSVVGFRWRARQAARWVRRIGDNSHSVVARQGVEQPLADHPGRHGVGCGLADSLHRFDIDNGLACEGGRLHCGRVAYRPQLEEQSLIFAAGQWPVDVEQHLQDRQSGDGVEANSDHWRGAHSPGGRSNGGASSALACGCLPLCQCLLWLPR